MHRRCNYDPVMVETAFDIICDEIDKRSDNPCRSMISKTGVLKTETKLDYYLEQYSRSGIADTVILPYLTETNVIYLSDDHLDKLHLIIEGMLQYQPFELATIHDEFTAHANNINWVRWQYKEILADLADSDLMSDILSQIHGKQGKIQKLSTNLGALIRNSNYALT